MVLMVVRVVMVLMVVMVVMMMVLMAVPLLHLSLDLSLSELDLATHVWYVGFQYLRSAVPLIHASARLFHELPRAASLHPVLEPQFCFLPPHFGAHLSAELSFLPQLLTSREGPQFCVPPQLTLCFKEVLLELLMRELEDHGGALIILIHAQIHIV